jgi:hypothetical protein
MGTGNPIEQLSDSDLEASLEWIYAHLEGA